MNRIYRILKHYDNYFQFDLSAVNLSYFFLILILFSFISCSFIDSQEISENNIKKNEVEDPIVENDPFEDLPCVIRCHLTPTPLADENKENLPVKLQCKDCNILNVIRVIDGDTVETHEGIVRFYSIDTPERGEKCFNESTERTKNLIFRDKEQPLIGSIRVEKSSRLKDNFGRLLFYVYTLDGDSIGEILIKEGLAEAWTKDGHHLDHFLLLQSLNLNRYSSCF